jgi:flavin reductase (DIM6/NTAB) family NADH-FMN oxidoreductase RutF
MRTSIKPPLLAVSIAHSRYSHGVIREAGAFVVAAPSVEMEEETRLFGSVSGRDHAKLAEAGSVTEAATAVECVLLSNAVLNIECRLQDVVDTGDHSIFVGEVLASHVNADESVKRLYTVATGHRFGTVTSVAGE